ncbi:MAG TPA: hypothetical protein VJ302_30455 [Blastocatellia bacterium]|nr:hypothetical protein [Blastocatellia bacterium]
MKALTIAFLLCFGSFVPIFKTRDFQAQVVRARLIPWSTPQEKDEQMLLIDWKNVGTEPIGQIKASITFYDNQNRELDKMKNNIIFLTHNDRKMIKPGQTYQEPEGEGLVFVAVPPRFVKAVRAEAVITEVGGIPIM